MSLKALIGGIQRFSTADGPGIRTSVFIKGCPLKCAWCHNPELISFANQLMFSTSKCIGCGQCANVCHPKAISLDANGVHIDRNACTHCFACVRTCYSEALRLAAREMSTFEVMEIVVRDKGYYTKTGGGMTISGGECLASRDFVFELIDEAKKYALSIAIDTSGFCDWSVLEYLADKVDYFLYDIKSIDDTVHRQYTGVSNEKILNNLEKLSDIGEDIREKILIRMPLLKDVNDSPDIISSTVDFLSNHGLKKVTLLPYHELGNAKYKSLDVSQYKFAPPCTERLEEICKTFKAVGINAEILGA